MIRLFKYGDKILNEKSILEAVQDNINDDKAIAIVDDEAAGALNVLASEGVIWRLYSSVMNIERDRQSRYTDYDNMEDDPLISSALELITDDVSQYSTEMNSTLWVANSFKYKDDIHQFLDSINFENNVWGWTYNLAKYGDFFLGINVEKGKGVVGLEQDVHPSRVSRIDINGKLAGFMVRSEFSRKVDIYNSSCFVHFISNYRPNFESVKVKIKKEDLAKYMSDVSADESSSSRDFNLNENTIPLNGRVNEAEFISSDQEAFIASPNGSSNIRSEVKNGLYSSNVNRPLNTSFRENKEDSRFKTIKISSKYGTSVLQSARQVYRLLNLMEAMMAMARISRTPQVRVFYVNTEGMTPKERRELIADIEEKFKLKKAGDIPKNLYKAEYNPAGWNDDIFIPYTGSKGDMRVDTIGGDVNIKDIEDIEYIKSKLFAALRIPQAFLGYDSSSNAAVPSGGAAALTKLDIRYGRMCKKVQRSLIEGIYRLVQIHLSYKYNKVIDLSDLSLAMVPVSTAEEDARMETRERRIGIMASMSSILNDFDGFIDKKFFGKFLFSQVLDFPNLDINRLFNPKGQPSSDDAGEEPPEAPEEDGMNFGPNVYKNASPEVRQKINELSSQMSNIFSLLEQYNIPGEQKYSRYKPNHVDLIVPALRDLDHVKRRAELLTIED